MYSKIETLFCVILSWVSQIHCYNVNKVLYFTSNCSSYEIHDVSRSQTYDLVFRGTTPPERCKIGFYQGLDGEVCVKATSYDVRDCDINLRFSTNTLKYYSCHDPPTTKECTYYGDFLHITLSTKLQFGRNKNKKVNYAYSSFTLHITQGKVREDASTSSVGAVMGPLLSAIIFIVLVSCCIAYVKRRAVQRNSYMTSGSLASQTPTVVYQAAQQHPATVYVNRRIAQRNPHMASGILASPTPTVVYQAAQQQPATGSTVHPPVQQPLVQGYGPPSAYGYGPVQPQGYGPMVPDGYDPSTTHGYRSTPTEAYGPLIPQGHIPSAAHGQGHPPGQYHGDEHGQHPYIDPSAPPPSYEEAKKYYM